MRLFKSAWGGCELYCASFETDDGRDLVVQKYTRGNGANVQNRGSVPRSVQAEIMFDEFRGQEEDADDRFAHFIALKESGKPQILVHPIYGSYRAEIGTFTHRIDASGVVSATAQFIAVDDNGVVTADPIGVSVDGGSASIKASADSLDNELSDVGIAPSSVTGLTVNRSISVASISDLARQAGDTFDDDTSTIRDALVQVGSVSSQLNQAIDTLQTSADIFLWPVHKAIITLAGSMLTGVTAVTGSGSGLFTMIVNQPMSLRRICADLYGDNFDQGYADALQLNDVPTPARIPSGTQLRLRQPSAL